MKKYLRYLKEIFRGGRPPKDVFHYLLGKYRYRLYYSWWNFLIRKHIKEQIKYRIGVMKQECYDNGECTMCGCSTTALQMCNKSCEGGCYPPMFNKKHWKFMKNELNWNNYVERD